MRFSILIVNYNGSGDFIESLRSLSDEARRLDGEVVVWDNASTDGSGRRLEHAGLPVVVIRSNENLGYASGMNGAAAVARGGVFVLMNPDVRPRPGAVLRLVEAAEAEQGPTLFGGVVLRADDAVDPNCHRALPTLDDIRREARFQRPEGVVPNEAALHDPARGPIPVPAVSGSVMAISRSSWDTLGPLDQEFFLYHEDTEWCRRADAMGMTVAVVPGALFAHQGGASTRQNEGPAFEARLLSDFRYYCVLGGETPETLHRLWCARLRTQHRAALLNGILGLRGSRADSRRRASIYWLLHDALARADATSLGRDSRGTRPGGLVDWPPPPQGESGPAGAAGVAAPARGTGPRVATILPDLEIGGAQKLVEKTVRETSDTFDHLVICMREQGPLFDPLRREGFAVHSIGMTKWRDRRSWSRAKHYLSLVDADLFHSHLIPSDFAMRLVSRTKRPWLSTKHSIDIGFGMLTRLSERLALAKADAVYAVSRTVSLAKKHLSNRGALPVVMPNPPTVPVVRREESMRSPFGGKRFRVLSLGRLHPVKKTGRFLETAKLLHGRDPGRYEFRIVGSGPEEDELQSRAKALGLGDVLTFHPFTDDVAKAVDWADCVLFFSEGEGLGIVILDTIARGRVPIVRRAGGAAEALPASLEECFVNEDSPERFADRVERFAQDPAPIRAALTRARDELRARKPYAEVLGDQYRKWIERGDDLREPSAVDLRESRAGDRARTAGRPRTRVLHVITRMILGGAQQNTLASVARVDPARFDSDLWTGPQTGSEGDLRAEAERIGVLMVYFRNVVRELNPVKDLVATWQLYRMLRKRRYDIVHTHSSKIGILGRIAAHFAGVPHVVHTAHGWGFHEHMAGWLRGIYVALEKLVLPMTDQLVSVSDETTRVGLEAGIGRPEDYLLIRSGIPTNEFHADPARGAAVRETLGIARDRFVIGTVGRLSPQKNPLDFVRVAGAICAKHDRAHFLSIGEGPLRCEVEATIRDAGLEKRVTLLGLRTDVPDLMRAMDLYVMTSLWEGLPRVVVQALATGVPVVSYDVAGTKEIVREGKNGYLVAPGDWQTLASRIDDVLSDDTLYAELRRVAANEFDTSFTEDKMIEDLEELYEGLMKKNGA